MLDLEQLQSVAQILDSIELGTQKLEKAFTSKNVKVFEDTKKEILNLKNKIAEIVK